MHKSPLNNCVKSEDLFGSLSNESEQSEAKQFEYKNNKTLEKMYYGFLNMVDLTNGSEGKLKIYNRCLSLIPTSYNAENIQQFCNFSSSCQLDRINYDYTIGFYLSALMNNLNQENIRLDIRNLKYEPQSLGFLNIKNLHIIGNVNYALGRDMTKGNILLDGNCGSNLGYFMNGGNITVNGNGGDNVGKDMCGGIIEVYGDVENVGYNMNGGEIHLHGHYTLYYYNHGGNIYHKGKLIVNKGKIVGSVYK